MDWLSYFTTIAHETATEPMTICGDCIHLELGCCCGIDKCGKLSQPITTVDRCPLGKFDRRTGAALRIAIILPVRNEKTDLESTIQGFRDTKHPTTDMRFYVIDDGSTDGGVEHLPAATDLTTIRHDKSEGEGISRNEGCELACAAGVDGFIVHDAHMWQIGMGGHERMVTTAMKTGGLVCGATHPLLYGKYEKDFVRYGGRLIWRTEPEDKNHQPGLRTYWNYHAKLTETPIQCLFGASYCMTPETFRRIGGWQDTVAPYGFGEGAMALKAFMLGIPTFCRNDAHFKHRFRGPRPYPMSGRYYWQNLVWCLRILIGEDLFHDIFEETCAKFGGKGVQALLDRPMRKERAKWLALKPIKSPKEAVKWLRI